MANNRETISALGAPKAVGPYSHAVRSGGLVFLSGQMPLDPDAGTLVEGSIGDQTRRCLDNLAVVASAAGTSLADAVRCGIYVTDMGSFGEVNDAYATYFESDPPARSTIGVASLPLGAKVEIDAIIVVAE